MALEIYIVVVVISAFIDQLRYNIPTSGRTFSIAVSLLFNS